MLVFGNKAIELEGVFLFLDNCQENSTRDTANKLSLKLCASMGHVFWDDSSECYVSVVYLAGQVLGNWSSQGRWPDVRNRLCLVMGILGVGIPKDSSMYDPRAQKKMQSITAACKQRRALPRKSL
jgi:hypothetical protein